MASEKLMLRAGKYYVPTQVEYEGDRMFFNFKFNRPLMAEIKLLNGRKWHGYDKAPAVPRKVWSAPINPRNMFQLDYLRQDRPDPYARWDCDPEIITNWVRSLFAHQKAMVEEAMTRRWLILAAEMGTGKTLAAIEVMERSGFDDWWWVGPKSALAAVNYEFKKWDSLVRPITMTYEGLKKRVSNWKDGDIAPQGVIFDESSRVKTITAQRTKAAQALADGMREDHGDGCYIIEMSGTPAPKSPIDWYSQCEIACPGFLKEGNYIEFKNVLSIQEQRENATGGTFWKLVTWRDNDTLCNICGLEQGEECHDAELAMLSGVDAHGYVPMKNEVTRLYQRMKGLVMVQFKKDCLDLPDKVYKIIHCKPDQATLNAAELLAERAPRVATALIWLRELSDGFQYKDVNTEITKICTVCHGKGEISHPDPEIKEMLSCTHCDGSGDEDIYKRETIEVPCPKEDALKELLTDHEEYGRLVVYAGFTGSINRVIRICQQQGWATFKVDGKGVSIRDANDKDTFLDFDSGLIEFQEKNRISKMVFIGQPGAAGMGLTLTASPSIVYWSNDHNGESRTQSEDRIHRPGMIGANIIDLIHLPTDLEVLHNLKAKRKLELMSLGQLSSVLKVDTNLEEVR